MARGSGNGSLQNETYYKLRWTELGNQLNLWPIWIEERDKRRQAKFKPGHVRKENVNYWSNQVWAIMVAIYYECV